MVVGIIVAVLFVGWIIGVFFVETNKKITRKKQFEQAQKDREVRAKAVQQARLRSEEMKAKEAERNRETERNRQEKAKSDWQKYLESAEYKKLQEKHKKEQEKGKQREEQLIREKHNFKQTLPVVVGDYVNLSHCAMIKIEAHTPVAWAVVGKMVGDKYYFKTPMGTEISGTILEVR